MLNSQKLAIFHKILIELLQDKNIARVAQQFTEIYLQYLADLINEKNCPDKKIKIEHWLNVIKHLPAFKTKSAIYLLSFKFDDLYEITGLKSLPNNYISIEDIRELKKTLALSKDLLNKIECDIALFRKAEAYLRNWEFLEGIDCCKTIIENNNLNDDTIKKCRNLINNVNIVINYLSNPPKSYPDERFTVINILLLRISGSTSDYLTFLKKHQKMLVNYIGPHEWFTLLAMFNDDPSQRAEFINLFDNHHLQFIILNERFLKEMLVRIPVDNYQLLFNKLTSQYINSLFETKAYRLVWVLRHLTLHQRMLVLDLLGKDNITSLINSPSDIIKIIKTLPADYCKKIFSLLDIDYIRKKISSGSTLCLILQELEKEDVNYCYQLIEYIGKDHIKNSFDTESFKHIKLSLPLQMHILSMLDYSKFKNNNFINLTIADYLFTEDEKEIKNKFLAITKHIPLNDIIHADRSIFLAKIEKFYAALLCYKNVISTLYKYGLKDSKYNALTYKHIGIDVVASILDQCDDKQKITTIAKNSNEIHSNKYGDKQSIRDNPHIANAVMEHCIDNILKFNSTANNDSDIAECATSGDHLFDEVQRLIKQIEVNSTEKRDLNNWLFTLHFKNNKLSKWRNVLADKLVKELKKVLEVKELLSNPNNQFKLTQVQFNMMVPALEKHIVNLLNTTIQINELAHNFYGRKVDSKGSLDRILNHAIATIKNGNTRAATMRNAI